MNPQIIRPDRLSTGSACEMKLASGVPRYTHVFSRPAEQSALDLGGVDPPVVSDLQLVAVNARRGHGDAVGAQTGE